MKEAKNRGTFTKSPIMNKKEKTQINKQFANELIKEKIKELEFDIRCHQKNIKLLFAYASGEKRSKNPKLKNYQRTENDDRQLLITVACLRKQIICKQQELAILKGVSSNVI